MQLDLYGNGNNAAHVYNYAEEVADSIVHAYAEVLAATATCNDDNACWAWTADGQCHGGPCYPRAVGNFFIEEIEPLYSASAHQ